MDEETEIEFISIALNSLEETLDLADRIYEKAKSHAEHSEDFQKKKITFELAKDI